VGGGGGGGGGGGRRVRPPGSAPAIKVEIQIY
jgi:hypothetical protein